ncbi:hypothetical protein D9M68_838250 [compost metagenome]
MTVRSNTSTSPDCSAVKRCWVDSAVPLNLVGSPNTAAATARQMSTSMPSHSPLLFVAEKPDTPSVRPHCTNPFFFTASRVGPATAAWDAQARASALAANKIDRFIIASPEMNAAPACKPAAVETEPCFTGPAARLSDVHGVNNVTLLSGNPRGIAGVPGRCSSVR